MSSPWVAPRQLKGALFIARTANSVFMQGTTKRTYGFLLGGRYLFRAHNPLNPTPRHIYILFTHVRLNKTSRQARLLPTPLLPLNPNLRPGDPARVLPSGSRPMVTPVRRPLLG